MNEKATDLSLRIIGELNEYQELAIKAGIPITNRTEIILVEFASLREREEQAKRRRAIAEMQPGGETLTINKESVSVTIPAGKYMMGYSKNFDALIVAERIE